MVIAVEKALPREYYNMEAFTYYDEVTYMLKEKIPDLVIMDVELANKSGIDLAKVILQKNRFCKLIFVSGNIYDSLNVYDVPHIEFVLKDQFEAKISGFIDRALKIIYNDFQNVMVIKSGQEKYTIRQREIIYLESQKRVVIIVSEHGKYSTYNKLDELQKQLSPVEFARCHQSYIVNVNYINRTTKTEITLFDGNVIPISQSHYSDIMNIYLKKTKNVTDIG